MTLSLSLLARSVQAVLRALCDYSHNVHGFIIRFLLTRVVLTVSSSSRASVSPVVLLKLLVLDEDREMFGLPLLHSFSLINGLLRKTDAERDENLMLYKRLSVFSQPFPYRNRGVLR